MKTRNQSYIIYLLLFIAIASMLYFSLNQQSESDKAFTLNELAAQIESGETVSRLVVGEDNSVKVIYRDESIVEQTTRKESETTLVEQLLNLGVSPSKLESKNLKIEIQEPSPWVGIISLAGYVIPFILLAALFWFIFRQAQGSNNAASAFGKSKARMFTGDHPTVTFDDVAGVEEPKEELREVVEFLKCPSI